MHYGEIKRCDIADGPGVRVTLFVSGCRNRCEGCFQPQTWAFDYGQPYTAETEDSILEMLRPAYIRGLTLLGGEPFEPENQHALLPLVRRVRRELPAKDIWAFSGYTFERMRGEGHPHCEVTEELLSMLDVLVDGPFILARKNLMLRFRGSDNQRLLDVPRSLSRGQATEWQG